MTSSNNDQDLTFSFSSLITSRNIFWTVIVISITGFVISGLGILNLLMQGLASTGMHDFVPMGIWLVFYIFFTGLSAGSFIVSTLAYVFDIEKFKPVGRRAVALALILLVNAPIFLLLDIGRPERVLNLIFYWNFTSILAWGTRLLLLYPLVCLIYLWALTYVDIVKQSKRSSGLIGLLYRILALGKTEIGEKGEKTAINLAKLMGLIGIPIALATHGYTGFLFSVISAHPLWNTPIMPILFLSSAIVSGAALLSLIVMVTDRITKTEDTIPVGEWATLLVTFLFIDVVLLLTEFITVLLANVEEHVKTWNVLLFGQYWVLFWVIEILIGVVIPIVLLLVPKFRNNKSAVFIASFCIVLGVLAKRINLIIGGQLTTALTGVSTTYIPTLTEVTVTIGGISAVAFFFIIVWKMLPLTRKKTLVMEVSK